MDLHGDLFDPLLLLLLVSLPGSSLLSFDLFLAGGQVDERLVPQKSQLPQVGIIYLLGLGVYHDRDRLCSPVRLVRRTGLEKE